MKPWKQGLAHERWLKKIHAEFDQLRALRSPAEHLKYERFLEAEARLIRAAFGKPPRPRKLPQR